MVQDKRNLVEAMEFYIECPEMTIFIDEIDKDCKTVSNDEASFNFTLIWVADCFGFVASACETYLPVYKD